MKRVLSLALIAGSLFAASPARAADDVVAQIPDTALGYVVVKDMRKASDAINRVAKQMELAAPNLLDLAKQAIKAAKGLDDNGSLAIAAVPRTNGTPFPVIFVKAGNFKELIGQLNPSDGEDGVYKVDFAVDQAFVGRKGEYAVFAPPEREFEEAFRQVLKSGKSVAVDEKTAAYTSKSQAYFVITGSGVTTLSQLAQQGLQLVKQQLAQAGPQAELSLAGIGIYEELFKWAGKEVSEVAVGMRIEDNGVVRFKKRVALKHPGELVATDSKAIKLLDSLPDWPYAMALAGEFNYGKSMDTWLQMSIDMMQSMGGKDLTKEQVKELKDTTRKMMDGMKSMSFTFGVPRQGESIYGRMGMVVETSDAEAYLDAYVKSTRRMGEVIQGGGLYRILEAGRKQVGGRPGAKIVIQVSVPVAGPEGEMVRRMLDKMYGKDGKITIYAASLDAKRIAMSYVSEANLQAIIESARTGQGLGRRPGHQTTANLLAGRAQLAGYVSPQGFTEYMKWVFDTVASLAPGDIATPTLPAYPGNLPPLGFSVQMTGDALQAELVAPAETLTGMGQYIKIVQQAISP